MSKRMIQLPNRYGYDVHLEQIEGDQYLFDGDNNAFEYHRVIFEKSPDEIHAVDPSGGPYLSIGYVVGKQTVTKIVHEKGKGYIVTLKPLHNEAD